MLRVIREFEPTWVIAENVRGLLSLDNGLVFEQVCLDLEASNYQVQPFLIPACAINAPHRRDRVWFVANNISKQEHATTESGFHTESCEQNLDTADATVLRCDGDDAQRQGIQRNDIPCRETGSSYKQAFWDEPWPAVATRLCTLDDGLRRNVVRPDGRRDAEVIPRPKGWRNASLKAAGNSIVPQVAVEIMKAIKSTYETPEEA
jgi:DNA (cytosine-5)-methyltransferase 1